MTLEEVMLVRAETETTP